MRKMVLLALLSLVIFVIILPVTVFFGSLHSFEIFILVFPTVLLCGEIAIAIFNYRLKRQLGTQLLEVDDGLRGGAGLLLASLFFIVVAVCLLHNWFSTGEGAAPFVVQVGDIFTTGCFSWILAISFPFSYLVITGTRIMEGGVYSNGDSYSWNEISSWTWKQGSKFRNGTIWCRLIVGLNSRFSIRTTVKVEQRDALDGIFAKQGKSIGKLKAQADR